MSKKIKVECVVKMVGWTVEYETPEIEYDPSVTEHYEEFEKWLVSFLKKNNVDYFDFRKQIDNIIIKHSYKFDTDERRNTLGNEIINHPDIKKYIRMKKIDKLNGT